jgi:transposase
VTDCDARIAELSQPFAAHLDRLQTIVGVGRRSAEVLVSEIGVDMSRFATAAHLASWARICPGTHQSAGKRRSAGTGTGNNWLRTTLLESAWAASHSRHSYLGGQYRRISKRLQELGCDVSKIVAA